MSFLQKLFGKSSGDSKDAGRKIRSPIDKLAIVIAAGGDATRMLYGGHRGRIPPGMSRVPMFVKKSCLSTMPVASGYTFVDVALGNISVLQKKAGGRIPCALVVGPNNQQVIRSAVQNTRLLHELNVQILEQDKHPVLDVSGSPIFWADDEIFYAPDGTGGCLAAVAHSDWLRDIIADGYEYIIVLFINDLASFSHIASMLDSFLKTKQDFLWISNDIGQRQLDLLKNTPEDSITETMIADLEDAPGAYLFRADCLKYVVELLEDHLVYKAVPIIDHGGNLLQSIRQEKFLSDVVRNLDRYPYLRQYEQLIKMKPGEILLGRYRIQKVRQTPNGILYDCIDQQTGESIVLDPNKKTQYAASNSAQKASKNLLKQVLSAVEAGETHSTFQLDIGQKKVGENLFDDFTVEDIKHGAFGIVYICKDENSNQTVAIKTFSDELRWAFPQQADHFGQEAYHWVLLDNHPNIVRASRVVEIFGRFHIVLEFVDGGSLRDVSRNQQIPLADGIQILLDTCYGVQFLHRQGLIHGDIKPENILLTKQRRAKLTDLGLAVPISEANAARGGTPGYQAPELMQGNRKQEVASDIYSLGAVALELFTGQVLSQSVGSGDYALPEIRLIVQNAISQNPSDRPSIDGLIDGLLPAYRKVAGSAYAPAEITYKEEENERFTYLANSLIVMGQAEKALSMCDDWIKKSPRQAEPRYTRALALYDLEQYNACYLACLEVRQNRTAFEEYKAQIGGLIELCKVQLGISEQSAEELEAYASMAMQINQSGHLALKYINAALRLNESLESAWAFKGECLYDFGSFAESIVCYKKALGSTDPRVAQIAKSGLARSEAVLSGKGGKQFQTATHIDQAELAFQAGEYKKSRDEFTEVLSIDPENSQALMGKGLAELNLGNVEFAIDNLRQSINSTPQNADNHFHLGFALLMNAEYLPAQEAFETALSLSPQYTKALHNKAICLLAQKKPNDAKSIFEEVLQREPGHAKAQEALQLIENSPEISWSIIPEKFWSDQALALAEKGLLREALICARNALKINSENATHWHNAGYFLWMIGQHRAAIEHCRRALEIDPTEVNAWNILGNALDDIGESDQSLDAFEKAVALNPNYYEAWNGRGLILQKKGQNQEALVSFEKALLINNRFGRGWHNKGGVLADMGRYQESIASYKKALAINPDHLGAANAMGISYLYLNEYEGAIDSFKQAIASRPDDADAWSNLGAAQFMQGDIANALLATQKALACNPNHGRARINLAKIKTLVNR